MNTSPTPHVIPSQSPTMTPQSSPLAFVRFVSASAAFSVGVGLSTGGLLIAVVTVLELAAR